MKYLNLISIVFFVLLISACQGDSEFGGESKGIKNGENWKGQGHGVLNGFGLGVNLKFALYKSGIRQESISFFRVPFEPGTYYLFNGSGQLQEPITGANFFTNSFDGDVLEDVYLVVEDSESYLTVTEYDESEQRLKGEYQATFYIDPTRQKVNPENPDTIRFENGTFEVVIEE